MPDRGFAPSGFTLVELMVSMALGLGLMSLMIGTIDKVLHASRVSAEAAETLERGYFLMDAIDTWVAGTSLFLLTCCLRFLHSALLQC